MSIFYRKYKSYDKYLKHQSKKLNIGISKKIKKFMPEYFFNNVRSFNNRIKGFEKYIKKGNILCLGARTGAEVVAFIELGFKNTIGIDINPGKNNKYVIKGDFHNMDFKNNSFDTIYSNCIDHAWNLRKLSKEVYRILKDDGILILEIDHLLNKNIKKRQELIKKQSKYESIMWENFNDIKKEFKEFVTISKFVSIYDIFLVVILKVKEQKT